MEAEALPAEVQPTQLTKKSAFTVDIFSPPVQKLLVGTSSVLGAVLLIDPFVGLHLHVGNLPIEPHLTAILMLIICSPLMFHSSSKRLEKEDLLSPIAFIRAIISRSKGASRWDELRKLDFRKWPSARGALILSSCMLGNVFLSTCYVNFIGSELVVAIWMSVLAAMALPAMGIGASWLGSKTRVKAGAANSSIVRACKKEIATSTRGFLTQTVPFASAYTGFVTFCLSLSFLPNGIGQGFAYWLHASLRDANMAYTEQDPGFRLLVCSLTAVSLIFSLNPLAVRLSAGFQWFLKNLFSNNSGDSIVNAFLRSIYVPIGKIRLPSKHPHLRSAWETVIYISVCYALLFWLAAFSPVPAIRNWLDACIWDAGFNLYMADSFGLQLFVASIVAAFGTVPFACMTCAFVPGRKPQMMLVSEQGLLFPQRILKQPIYFWSELKMVSAKKLDTDSEFVKLSFKSETIKLKTKDIEREKLAELLAAADEYANNCKFNENAIKLRSQLSESNKGISLAEGSKFESTIFLPHKPGDLLKQGTYRVVRKLASKPLNAVYLCRFGRGQFAVVKQYVLPQNSDKMSRQKLAFQRECELLRSLSHPLIATVLDVFEERDASYLVLEHIPGTDLRDLVKKRGARKEKLVLQWALDLCRQLQYLHAQNPPILHRDLTPDNLMLDIHGQVRVIDFGAAHQFMEGVTGTLIGKQAYIAPEQLRGKPSVRSDIYSFGATLYFLLSGNDPKALQQCDPINDGLTISPWLGELISKCTAFDENDRPNSVDEIINTLSL